MKPYKFQPYLKTTIWGGYQIAPFKGIFYIFGNATFLTATM